MDLNLDEKGKKDEEIKINLDNQFEKEKVKDKIPRNLSPIHRENSNGENIEDELNKGMIDTDE